MTKHKYEYCVMCGRETDQMTEACNCGSRDYVYGDNFTYTNGKITCGCGGDKFTMGMHINRSPYFNKSYSCDSCGSSVGVQSYVPGVG